MTVTHTGRGGGCVTSQVPTPTSNKSYCADHQVFTPSSPSKLQTIPRRGTIIYSLSLGPQISLDPVPNHKIISPKINLGNLLLSGLFSLQAHHHIALFLFLRRHHFLQYPLHSASDNYFYQTDYPISTKIRQSKVVSQETEKTCGTELAHVFRNGKRGFIWTPHHIRNSILVAVSRKCPSRRVCLCCMWSRRRYGPGQCLAFVCGPRLPPARARPSAPRHARSRASARSNDLNCVPD